MATGAENRRLDDDLLEPVAEPSEFLVLPGQGVTKLMDEDLDARIRGQLGENLEPALGASADTLRAARELLDPGDAVAVVDGELLERRQEVRV